MENQISIEEIKAAVLAECEANKNRLVGKFPNCILVSPCATFDPINGSHTRHDLLAVGIDGGGEFTIVSIRPNSSFGEIVVAYRLLGLEAKAKDAEIERLKTHLANVAIEARRHEANSCWDFRDYVAGLAERVAPEVSEIDRLREGLKSIVDYEGESWMDFNDKYCELRDIARNTLEGGTES